jgi:hypothetical protein
MAKREKTGGRQKGSPNKASAEIKAVAKEYGPAAIKKLAELAGLVKGKPAAVSEQAQVSANREILDRGYGKPTQGVELAPTEGLEQLLDRILGKA